MTKLKTIYHKDFTIIGSDIKYDYQRVLTAKLDKGVTCFDQEIINEIVLWKLNRYAIIDNDTLELLNDIDKEATELDKEKTTKILKLLLNINGIQLPMASTILRFRNRNIYQIIDQRVYRIINKNKKLKLKTHPSDKNVKKQIDLYFKYLKKLTLVCEKFKIDFDKSDRILYKVDKRINKGIPLDNY